MDFQLQSVAAEKFADYDKLTQAFPPGLTLLLGDNGTGKSTVIEVVVWCLYGVFIRAKGNPRPSGGSHAGVVGVLGDKQVEVQRSRKGSKTELKLTFEGKDISGQTPTETQAKINDLFGNREQFIATRVFAKDFMARFAVATDKERKQMIEQLLGLGRFDVALGACRSDLAAQKQLMMAADVKLQTLRTQLDRQQEAVASTQGVEVPEVGPLESTLVELEDQHTAATTAYEKVQGMVEKAERSMQRTNFVLSQARRDMAQAEEAAAKMRRRRADTLEHTTCPVCFRAMDGDSEAAIAAHFDAEQTPLADKIVALQADVLAYQEDFTDMEDTLRGLRARREEAKGQVPSMKQISSLRERLAAARQVADERQRRAAEVEETKGEIAKVEKDVAQASAKIDVLKAVEESLGLRGARTLLLGRALGRIEDGANEALSHLGLPLSVELSGTTQLKSAKREVDAISIKVSGVRSGVYDMSSGGERGRVDVGFLLGLAQLSGAGGWMAYDEVFDALDPEGAARVASYLGELSKHRQILVISHSNDLRSEFPHAQVLRATKQGGVSQLGPA